MKKLIILLLTIYTIFSLSAFAEEYIAFRALDGEIQSLAVPEGISAEEYANIYNARYPGVQAEPDDERHLMAVPSDPMYMQVQMAYELIHASEAWNFAPHQQVGKPVIVAVIDSGCNVYHEDLKDRLLTGYNVVYDSTDVVDNFNHGTAVCGLIAAAANDLGAVGVAGNFDVKILPIAVVKASGGISASHVAKAIEFAIAQGADVINMSLGGKGENALEKAAVEKAIAAGIVVVSAAGNEDGTSYYYPASYDNCISVGSCNAMGVIAQSSVRNDKVTVAAPGSYIASTSNAGNDMYGTSYSGTSFASPIVAGVCAMLKAAAPTLTAQQVKAVLEKTATDAGDIGRDDYYGYGYVNAKAALLSVLSLSEEEALAANRLLCQARELVPIEDTLGVCIEIPETEEIHPFVIFETYNENAIMLNRQLLYQTGNAAISKTFLASKNAKTVKIYIWTDMHPLCDVREFQMEVTSNENS